MKKLIILGLTLFSATSSSLGYSLPEESKKGVYMRVDGGASYPLQVSDENEVTNKTIYKFKKRPFVGVGIGYQFNEVLKADINFQHRKNEVSKPQNTNFTGYKHYAAFLNWYLNLTTHDYITPYITAGVGYGRHKINSHIATPTTISKITTEDSSKNRFLWNIGVGTTVNIFKHLDLDFAYKYTHLGDSNSVVKTYASDTLIDLQKPKYKKNRAHEVSAGIIVSF